MNSRSHEFAWQASRRRAGIYTGAAWLPTAPGSGGRRPRAAILPRMRIYTRTGDEGETGLFGGGRVPKDDPRVAAYGDVDELNSVLGFVRTTPPTDLVDDVLEGI